ncbi:PAK4-inhibitor INKA2 isoform X2 [Hypomesus transpacificus]|nr:PAK4-inhibitor INKA2 isoform X2 [Hypomesus transpacificus]XP_046882603.1 PAK4-inhibitor INKA2 isoform X2 [Hypomesus transpacificus]
MKEAGDGLHVQMNSMMGALQELKLLQVHTALEQLDVSGRPVPGAPAPPPPPPAAAPICGPLPGLLAPRPPLVRTTSRESQSQSQRQSQSWADQHRSSLDTSPSSSSLESETLSLPNPDLHPQPRPLPRRVSGYTAPQVDFCGPRLSHPPPAPAQAPPQPLDLPGILYSLSREGPSLDSDFSQDSMDDSSDWTSSLMSRCRNRQPLVLGDNVFADLVGNWLDLPELEREEEDREEGGEAGGRGSDRPNSPAHPLRLSRSQEICRKFSLTTNIFKKFLRGVRPDRDKLLKERPGWAAAPETGPQGGLSKRPRKAPASKARGSFYLPFWAAGAPQGKGRPGAPALEEPGNPRPLFSGILIDRRLAEGRVERTQPLFDYNTAVWV